MNGRTKAAVWSIALAGLVFVSSVIGIGFFAAQVVHSGHEEEWKVMFTCATGLMPSMSSGYTKYDNGTHRIDMESCAWIPNAYYPPFPQVYRDIPDMSCSEIMERHDAGIPYKTRRDKNFAEAKISICSFINDWKNSPATTTTHGAFISLDGETGSNRIYKSSSTYYNVMGKTADSEQTIGKFVKKSGIATGVTYGSISGNLPGGNYNTITFNSGNWAVSGDSGSPVFYQPNTRSDNVYLYGLLVNAPGNGHYGVYHPPDFLAEELNLQ